MSLYLITGLPGSGKSTVCEELKRRGYEAYDGDYDHLAHWFDAEGNVAEDTAEKRTPEFVQTHTRAISEKTIAEFAHKASETDVFICNDPENEDILASYFTHIFALVLDESIREQRVANRKNNPWGKLPHEKARDQLIRPIAEKRYQQSNYTKVDANRPTDEVTDSILQYLEK